MDSAASWVHGSVCWAQQLLLALLSDKSNSGQSHKLVSAVPRVPVEESSSNLLMDILKCLVFPFPPARVLSLLICMPAKFSS